MNITEKQISEFYNSINITDYNCLSLEEVVRNIDVNLVYWPHSSSIAIYNNEYIVFINESINVQRQWQHFGHEMSHYFYDEISYDSLYEGYASYGESKADYFAYHFCVPTFMLLKMGEVTAYDIMYLFNVEFDFALRRLEMYESKLIERRNKYAWSYK